MSGRSANQGLTLFELLYVLVGVSAVIAVSVPKIISLRASHRDDRRVSDLKAARSSLEAYYQAHQAYPATDYAGLPQATQGYIPPSTTYHYLATRCSPTCQGFELWTQLDNGGDSRITVGPDRYSLSE